jgi:hypothetical protein
MLYVACIEETDRQTETETETNIDRERKREILGSERPH